MFRSRAGIYVILCVALLCSASWAEKVSDIRPQGYVTDLAGVIDPTTRQKIESLAYEIEQKTSAQIGVVTVKSLDDEPIEDYAVDLYKHLGIGSKKTDRGVLLLLAPKERRYRIEVGYGLEPVINDARAGDIGRSMVPLLRRNDYGAAVSSAVSQLAQMIAADKGVTLNGVITARAPPQDTQLPFWVIPLIIFGIFIVLKMFAISLRSNVRGGRRRGPGFFWFPPMGGGWGSGGFGGSSGGFSGGGFGGFGGGLSGGGGASGGW